MYCVFIMVCISHCLPTLLCFVYMYIVHFSSSGTILSLIASHLQSKSCWRRVPYHKLPIAQSTVISPIDYAVCKCLIIKLSIHVVTVVANRNKAYNRHTWVGTKHRLTNHRPDRPSTIQLPNQGPGKPDMLSQNT